MSKYANDKTEVNTFNTLSKEVAVYLNAIHSKTMDPCIPDSGKADANLVLRNLIAD
jgi:hypothetical protein